MKQIFLFSFLCLLSTGLWAQAKTENLVIVTLDGMRWQEVFGGADSVLINDSVFTPDRDGLKKRYWAATPDERRLKLFPFFWKTIAAQGQLYGNRHYDNRVNNANRYWFSYPGYNEIFTGYPDTLVNSNDKIPNRNENVLEFLNRDKRFSGKVAAFTSWDVFDAIFNEKRSGFLVSSGFDPLPKKSSPELKLLDEMQMKSPRPLGDGVRTDFVTYYLAKEYLKAYQPKAMYISFDETDDYAHGGKYDYYLDAAHLIDTWISDLWNYLQQHPAYKGKTTLLITTDHGRGDEVKTNWQHHGSEIPDAGQIWIAVIGPDTPAAGEVKTPMLLYQEQIASTLAELVGLSFKANHPVAGSIPSVFQRKMATK